jgi:integrase
MSTKSTKKPLALKVARRIYDEAIAGTYDVAPRGGRTVQELLEMYFRDCMARVEGRKDKSLQPISVERMRNAIGNVLDEIRVTRIEEITEKKVAEYKSRRLSGEIRKRQTPSRRASAFTYNTEVACLRAFLSWCKRERFLRVIPNIPRAETGRKGKTVILTESEVGPLLANLRPHEAWAAFLIVNSGLRLGEMQFLEWSDVDLERGVLYVRRKPELGFSPKGGKERDVPIAPDLADELIRRRKASGWVCPGLHDKQMHRRVFGQAVRAAAVRAGIPKNVTPHTLRHTFGSLAVLKGMPLRVLADIMGHSTITMTEIYVHSEQEQRIAAMATFRIAGGMEKKEKVVSMPGMGGERQG